VKYDFVRDLCAALLALVGIVSLFFVPLIGVGAILIAAILNHYTYSCSDCGARVRSKKAAVCTDCRARFR
jgi:hypothetical protein